MKRIFVVGCARSGTTFLQSILASHSTLLSFTESHFFTKNFRNFKTRDKFYFPNNKIYSNVKQFFADNDFNKDIIDDLESKKNKLLTANQWTKQFVDYLDLYTLNQNKSGWIEKTPSHLRHIRYIDKYVSNSLFIHILRNGKNVVASLYDVSNSNPSVWGSRTVEQCVSRWNKDLEISLKWLDNKNHIGIRYEELVEDPKTVIKELCNFLKINWDDNMLNYQSTTNRLVRKHEVWKKDNFNKIQNKNRFEQLNNEQKVLIEKKLDMQLESKFPSIL